MSKRSLERIAKLMKENKPVVIKEQPKPIGWESCVKEYYEKDKERWNRLNNR